jgi:hypothetical protein
MAQLVIDSVKERFPDWTIDFDYGYFNATHSNYDASWEGEEDGWVDNGLRVIARTLEGLCEEIEAMIDERGL